MAGFDCIEYVFSIVEAANTTVGRFSPVDTFGSELYR
jgi:hypothetical protein